MSSNTSTSSSCYHPPTVEPVPQVELQLLIGALYWVTAFVSVAGNVLVIVVHCSGSKNSMRAKSSSSKRSTLVFSLSFPATTSTPFRNIRNCLNSLALTSMPFSYANLVLGRWPYAHFLCPLAQYGQLLSAAVTSATLTLISVER